MELLSLVIRTHHWDHFKQVCLSLCERSLQIQYKLEWISALQLGGIIGKVLSRIRCVGPESRCLRLLPLLL
jgi:hypothetical protein